MSLPQNFSSLSAAQKLTLHMQRMEESKYPIDTELPKIRPTTSLIKLAQNQPLSSFFLYDTDERDLAVQGAIKPIHPEGVSAPIVLEIGNAGSYTGVFKTGGAGIIRLSRAVAGQPFAPGLGLKVFIDGRPSINIHAMYSADGQKELDFFAHSFTTHIATARGFTQKILAFFFHRAIPSISTLPCGRPVDEKILPQYEAASVEANGTEVKEPKAPEELLFVPKVSAPCNDASQFRQAIMKQVKVGAVLYEVQDKDGLVFGKVRTTGPFVASKHGDQMLFKHQRFTTPPRACPMG